MRNIEHNKKLLSTLVVVTFVLTIAINSLANILPLNNIRTGDVSDKYANLFTPVSFTFAIWIVIYILLTIYTVYQYNFNSRRPDNNDRVVRKVNTYFVISNIANPLWIVCWHFDMIALSMVFMLVLWLMLITIRINITHRSSLSKSEKKSIELPFSIYLGWITVATIANFTTLLVYLEWDRFGYDEAYITVATIIISVIIGVLLILAFKDIAIALVFLWAYIGILYKHVSMDYFAGVYNNIVVTTIIAIILVLLVSLVVLITKKPRTRRRSKSLVR